MEEIKTELNRARTHSARLREEVHVTRNSLEKEQQRHKKTQKELEELKSIHETMMANSKKVMDTKVLELKSKIEQLEEELSAKEVFVEETARLRTMCDQLDDDLRNAKENFEKTSKENKELVTKLSDYENNVLNQTNCSDKISLISMQREIEVRHKIPNGFSPHIPFIEDAETKLIFRRNDAISSELLDETRKDLARVTREREDLQQKYEELEKQLEETLASLDRQRSASFHDRATSPGEPIQFDFEGKLVQLMHCYELFVLLTIASDQGGFSVKVSRKGPQNADCLDNLKRATSFQRVE